ncbi:DUF1585 domain-containing protein [Alcanivorax profundi]|uniref:DUF1585 domain-containing protein n=1 Tax=Alcanivorax profundi TaxID=2338368 RepID=A0A418XTW0_9GAMM|nr:MULTISPECIES: DUF1585 domain-containing protein [Alcanivorax]RJG16144.1 DUF1585 domain-containing protein [Alcanivorax profundi]
MRRTRGIVLATMALLLSTQGQASSRDQAQRIHNRLAGVPADASTLDTMASMIDGAGGPQAAAELAMEHPAFYNVTLKQFAAPWTNEAQDVFVPLNDYTATVIGAIRDDVDFRRILYADLLYVGNASPAAAADNNAHYRNLENQHADLKEVLQPTSQVSQYGTPAEAVAGVLTSRAAAQAFFYAGTNRAMFRFTLMNHMCRDLEQVKDVNRPSDRIRQDVSRSPGGDSRIFRNNCIGCHSGMDPMAQAFAYYDWQGDQEGDGGRMLYNTSSDPDTGTRVQGKYLINSNNFPWGYITPDDRWDNYWREGTNANLGWDSTGQGYGNGAASLGRELAHSDTFATCQAEKVFEAVCLRKPADSTDTQQVASMTTAFKNNNYRMKSLFADAAVYCMGD